MNFYTLLEEINHEAFESVLRKHHIEERERKEFHSFIERLLAKEIEVTNGILQVDIRNDDDLYEVDAGVLQEDGQSYAIDFIPWEECLGYQVDENGLEKIGNEEFAFHILYDMSFDGFYEEVRNASLKELTDRIERAENGETEWIEWTENSSVEDLFDLIDKDKNKGE